MAGRARLDLSSLTTEELADLLESAEGFVCQTVKIDDRRLSISIERRMGAAVTRAWKNAAETGLRAPLRALLAGPFTNRRLKSFLAKLGAALDSPLSTSQLEVVKARLREIYRVGKRAAVGEAKGRFVFGDPDVRAIAASHRQQLFWINNYYADHLSERISAVSREVLLESGYTHREAGRVLTKAMRQELGLTAATGPSGFASTLPERYAGNPERYFQEVSSVAGHQSRVFGRMRGFSDCGVVTFELINPMDERTGEICREMHGQVFSVDLGVDRMNAIIGARTPEEVRLAAPWLSAKALSEALGPARPGSREASEALRGLSVMLPPFHPLCRTEPVIHT